jgi:hypothetical protein
LLQVKKLQPPELNCRPIPLLKIAQSQSIDDFEKAMDAGVVETIIATVSLSCSQLATFFTPSFQPASARRGSDTA